MKHRVAAGWLGVSIILAWLSSAHAQAQSSLLSSCGLFGLGCPRARFVDTGSTIIDRSTGLEWEKKTDDGSVHDWDERFQWSVTSTAADGSLFTAFVGALNNVAPCTSTDGIDVQCAGACFAGHCDWRIPEVDELATIHDPEAENCDRIGPGPCIDPIFGPTTSAAYWTATTSTTEPHRAWVVGFGSDFRPIIPGDKVLGIPARAVRNRQ